jgi:hypothetical protein
MEENNWEEDIIQMIKIIQLQCTGHLQRMANNETHRRIMDLRLEGRRTVQRPKIQWMDDVVEDLRKAGIRRWWMIAGDRIMEESTTESWGL